MALTIVASTYSIVSDLNAAEHTASETAYVVGCEWARTRDALQAGSDALRAQATYIVQRTSVSRSYLDKSLRLATVPEGLYRAVAVPSADRRSYAGHVVVWDLLSNVDTREEALTLLALVPGLLDAIDAIVPDKVATITGKMCKALIAALNSGESATGAWAAMVTSMQPAAPADASPGAPESDGSDESDESAPADAPADAPESDESDESDGSDGSDESAPTDAGESASDRASKAPGKPVQVNPLADTVGALQAQLDASQADLAATRKALSWALMMLRSNASAYSHDELAPVELGTVPAFIASVEAMAASKVY